MNKLTLEQIKEIYKSEWQIVSSINNKNNYELLTTLIQLKNSIPISIELLKQKDEFIYLNGGNSVWFKSSKSKEYNTLPFSNEINRSLVDNINELYKKEFEKEIANFEVMLYNLEDAIQSVLKLSIK